MASYEKKRAREIDYIYARYPLWIRYSGLPRQLGPVTWAVFQRLLELRERFESRTFFYALERLAETSGIKNKRNMCSILDRLVQDGLIKYKTTQGRGKATEFEILEPLKTPLPEEDVYRVYPRLASKSHNKRLSEIIEAQKKVIHDPLFQDDPKKVIHDPLLEKEKVIHDPLLGDEKVIHDPLLGAEKVIHDHPIKKIYIKRQQQQKDLFHDVDPENRVDSHHNKAVSGVVVALNIESLKEYGIAGEQAARYLKRYTPQYLLEKIEIIEHKRYCGEQIRTLGGMLKKAIDEDWQPPEGFTTRAQREEEARREREAKELEARETKERAEQEKRSRENAAAAEEWKKTASADLRSEIHERARSEVLTEYPDTEEKLLRVPIRLRENKIIAEEYMELVKRE